MKKWWVRLRGLLGLSTIGGGMGAMFGAAGTLVFNLVTSGAVLGASIANGAALGGFFGFFAAGGVAVLMTTLGARRSLEEIAPWRGGLWGLAAGFAVPAAVFALPGGAISSIVLALPWLVLGGGVGGLLGAGLVAIARGAPEAAPLELAHEPLMLDGGEKV